MFLGDGVLWLIGEFRGVFETDAHWGMVTGNRWIASVLNYGVYRQGEQWGRERGGGVEKQKPGYIKERAWVSNRGFEF